MDAYPDRKKSSGERACYGSHSLLWTVESGEYGYTYDGLQRLLQVTKDGQLLRDYTYDAFGNRIRMEDKERGRVNTYHYNAMNRLERAWNYKGEEAAYRYNGMGQRVERRSGSKLEEYILDFTKPYHNLLSIQREEERESFYWDYTQPYIWR